MDSDSHGASGDTHLVDGYAAVRVVMRLQERLVFPSNIALWVDAIRNSRLEPPRLNLDPSTYQPIAPSNSLPFLGHDGLLFFRFGEQEAADPGVSASFKTMAVARQLWQLAADGLDERDPDVLTQYAEASALWEVTLACPQCLKRAVGDTRDALIDAIGILARAWSFASPVAIAPFPTPLAFEPYAVKLDLTDLNHVFIDTLGETLEAAPDPRLETLERLGFVDRQPGLRRGLFHLTESVTKDVARSMLAQQTLGSETAPYFAFVADAARALQVDQSASACVVLCAQASESLLDLVLIHLCWWLGDSYQQAGDLWSDGLMTRVETHYQRLGGTWDTATSEFLGGWRQAVPDIRNRIVHGGLPATYQEGEAALAATKNLYAFLCKVALSEKARSVHQGLFHLLDPGATKETNRQREAAREMDRLAKDPFRTFVHYRALSNRVRAKKRGGGDFMPRASHALTLCVVPRHGDEIAWQLYDTECHYVCDAEIPPLGGLKLSDFIAGCRQLIREGLEKDTFILRSSYQPAVTVGASWADALSELPFLHVMRTE